MSGDPPSAVIPGLVTALFSEGIRGLYHRAREWADYRPGNRRFAQKCDLCMDIRRHLALKEGNGFPELAPAGHYRTGRRLQPASR